MTNKEKAKELGNKYARQYHHNNYIGFGEFVFSNEEIEKACNEMTEFMIEKASEWLKEHAEEYTWYDFDAEAYKIPDNFLTDFKQAMEE